MAPGTPTPLRPTPDPSPPALQVAAALIFRAGRLLITQRPQHAHLGGLWEFPGGKCEPGETHERALARELREELAVEVQVGPIFESVRHAYPGRTVRIQFHLCRLVSGEPAPVGCPALRWVDRAGLDLHDFPAADARLLRRLKTDQSLWE